MADDEKPKRRANGEGCLREYKDKQRRTRFRIGLTPPPPLKGRQKWFTLELGTQESKAKNTFAAWLEDSKVNPREYFPDLFEGPNVQDGESLSKWFGRWFDDRAARGIQTNVDRGRVTNHVPAELLSKPAASVTSSDLEGIVETLDRKVAAKEMKWKNASNVWGVINKAFNDMAHGKTRSLRVRTDNPAADVRGPDRGERTLKQYLYPSEFEAFVSCEDVPLEWRTFVAVATYLYVRPGELEALEWPDIDLARGTIHVHRAIDRERGGTKGTKTDVPRKFQMEPGLLPLLHALHDASGGKGRVLPVLPFKTNAARDLRRLLKVAKVDREELHDMEDATRKALTAYDLRATGITWRAVRGDDPLKIKSAAGHKRFATSEIYIREAEAIRDGFGVVFPSLEALANYASITRGASNSAEALWSRRGSNPRKAEKQQENSTDRVSDPVVSPALADDNPAKVDAERNASVDPDPVEVALASALAKATEAGRWDVVAQLARELEARRTARNAPNVVRLALDRAKR